MILGFNFGTVDATVTSSVVSIGACSTSAWTSATALQCSSPANSNPIAAFVVNVGATRSTRTLGVSFDGALLFACNSAVPVWAATSITSRGWVQRLL